MVRHLALEISNSRVGAFRETRTDVPVVARRMTPERGDATASTELKTIRLPIPKVHCPWTAERVAETLQRAEGVVETALESRADTVVARYDQTSISEAAVTAAAERPASGGVRTSTHSHTDRRSSGCRCGCRDGSR